MTIGQDIAQAIFEVYAEHNFRDEEYVITNVVSIAGNKTVPVPEEFEFVLKHKLSGIPAFTQRCYLEEYRDIHPEARRIIHDPKPQMRKAWFLTGKKMKKDPEVQVEVAKVKDLPQKIAQEFVGHVKKGKIKKKDIQETGKAWKARKVQDRGKPYKFPKSKKGEVVLEGSFDLDGINLVAKIIRIFTHQDQRDEKEYTDDLISSTRDYRLQWMKRMDVQTMNNMYNRLTFLQKLINCCTSRHG